MPMNMKLSASDVSEIFCFWVYIEIDISVMGSMNCINPVTDNGIFPVEYDSINKGVMETAPAIRIRVFDGLSSSSLYIIGMLSASLAIARPRVRNSVSTNSPLTASKEEYFFI